MTINMNQKGDEKKDNEDGLGQTHKLELTEKVPVKEQGVGLGRTYKLDILEKVSINTNYRFLFNTLNKSVTETLKHFYKVCLSYSSCF